MNHTLFSKMLIIDHKTKQRTILSMYIVWICNSMWMIEENLFNYGQWHHSPTEFKTLAIYLYNSLIFSPTKKNILE